MLVTLRPAAIDAGMMHLGIESDLVSFMPSKTIELQSRTGAIEKLGYASSRPIAPASRVVRSRKAARKMWRSI